MNEEPIAKPKPVRKRPPRKTKTVVPEVAAESVVEAAPEINPVDEQPEPEPEPEPEPSPSPSMAEDVKTNVAPAADVPVEPEQVPSESKPEVEPTEKPNRRVTINLVEIEARQEVAKASDQVALLTDLIRLSRRERQKITEELSQLKEQFQAVSAENEANKSTLRETSFSLIDMTDKHGDCKHTLYDTIQERDQWQRLFRQADAELQACKETAAVTPDPQMHILELTLRLEDLHREKSQWVIDRNALEQRCGILEERVNFFERAHEATESDLEARRRCVIV